MGLNLIFERKVAEEAGLVFKVIPNNGTYDEGDDPTYIAWCKASSECIQVPGQEYYVQNDSSYDDFVMVRANKWGSTYEPLTKWLEANQIKWSEG